MDLVLASRFALPVFALFAFLFIVRLTQAPLSIVRKSLSVCWVTGLSVAICYILGNKLGYWHYTLNYLIFGLPLDRFFSASIAYGAGFGLIYWWLRKNKSRYLFPFIIFVPVYGVLTDIAGTWMTGSAFWSVDNPYWFIADLVCWIISWSIMLVLYQSVVIIKDTK